MQKLQIIGYTSITTGEVYESIPENSNDRFTMVFAYVAHSNMNKMKKDLIPNIAITLIVIVLLIVIFSVIANTQM